VFSRTAARRSAPIMYLTAQHVRNGEGQEEVHAFLHLHDRPDCRFPAGKPLSVPEQNPGRLVTRSTPAIVAAGGNSVIAYLDLIAEDRLWPTRYQDGIDAAAELALGKRLPWVITVDPVLVIFNANEGVPVVSEYQALLGAAMSLWASYEARHPSSR
jgi:hypothetical protein